jgi:hypothetical protein
MGSDSLRRYTFRVDQATLKRADALLSTFAPRELALGGGASRAGVLRLALVVGLEELERQARERGTTTSTSTSKKKIATPPAAALDLDATPAANLDDRSFSSGSGAGVAAEPAHGTHVPQYPTPSTPKE